MKYCVHCGKQLLDAAVICPGCGCPAQVYQPPNHYSYWRPFHLRSDLVRRLSERIQANAIIWLVIGGLQILLGLIDAWFTLIIGVLNLLSAFKDLNYSKTVLENPTGIVRNYEPLTGPIVTLIYNLLIGGVIGVVGSIYYFIGLRGFVMRNRSAFEEIERSG